MTEAAKKVFSFFKIKMHDIQHILHLVSVFLHLLVPAFHVFLKKPGTEGENSVTTLQKPVPTERCSYEARSRPMCATLAGAYHFGPLCLNPG